MAVKLVLFKSAFAAYACTSRIDIRNTVDRTQNLEKQQVNTGLILTCAIER